jgi:tripartite-type tricarboxylate transporter receptor subunit TctC
LTGTSAGRTIRTAPTRENGAAPPGFREETMSRIVGMTGAACAVAAALLSAGAARGESAAEFYGKNDMTMVIGYNPGGTYDLYARAAAKHLQKHLPGTPNIVAKNIPGLGGTKATNYLYQQGLGDGSMIGVVSQNIALQQVLKHKAVRYDARRFQWLGRMTSAVEVTVVWNTVPVKTIADARKREVVLGGTSAGSSTDTNPKLMNTLAGTKFKLVLGYKGTTGAMLAMERGEVEGTLAVVQNLLVQKPDWITDRKVSVLVQYSQKRHKAFPDAPAMVEFGDTPEDKEILNLYGSTAEIGRSVLTPPGVPRDRLAALRKAFDAMVTDPEFVAEMEQRKMEIDPLTGDEVQAMIDRTFAISPAAAKRAAAARN